MKILTVDVGTGTQDIYLYDSRLDLENGFKLERETEKKRIEAVAKESKMFRGKTHPTLGRPVASMPARDFFRLTQKYGHKEVHSKEFIKYFNKKLPELSPNRI